MAEIRPFSGIRFKLQRAEELAQFVAPPYDMLDAPKIDELYRRNDYNIVRVTQNRPLKEDRENADRHRRAAALLRSWMEKGILRRDAEPSVYIYEQRFHYDRGMGKQEIVRTGVVALVRLVEFEERIVLPHEATLSGPKRDRYELLDACRTHTELILGLLSDDGRFHSLLRESINDRPDGRFTDENGVTHSLHRCNDQDVLKRLAALAQGGTILIADGHHRYETSLEFYRDHPEPRYAYTLMTLVSTADPGLLIRPFHRLVRRSGRKVEMLGELKTCFAIEDRGEVEASKVRSFLASDKGADILFLNGSDHRLYECTLNSKGRDLLSTAMPERSMMWKTLPVSMINIIVVNTIMGLPLDGKVLHDVIDYVNDPDTAIAKCASGEEFYGGFFVRPTSIATVGDIVAAGERMPQKSTNFFPKVYSGLVLYGMDN